MGARVWYAKPCLRTGKTRLGRPPRRFRPVVIRALEIPHLRRPHRRRPPRLDRGGRSFDEAGPQGRFVGSPPLVPPPVPLLVAPPPGLPALWFVVADRPPPLVAWLPVAPAPAGLFDPSCFALSVDDVGLLSSHPTTKLAETTRQTNRFRITILMCIPRPRPVSADWLKYYAPACGRSIGKCLTDQ